MPPVYQSLTSILVEGQKVPEAYVKSTVTVDMSEKLKTLNTQIMSRTRLQKIIDDYDLYRTDEKKPGRIGLMLARLGLEKKTTDKGGNR